MENQLQSLIDGAKAFGVVRPTGEFRLELPKSANFFVGRNFAQNVIRIDKPELVLDFTDAVLRLDVEEPLGSDINVIFLAGMAKHVRIINLKLYVYCKCPATVRKITGIYNTAFGVKLENCRVEIVSEYAMGVTAVANYGGLDTHLETKADNFSVSGCFLKAQAVSAAERNCAVYGFYNELANSVSLSDSFVYANVKGNGGAQRATGVYTNGRFGRFVGNNIKANGAHNAGKLLEAAHACGFANEGLYSLIASNNIVGEWGGTCVGLENRGSFAKVNGNKILATHTVKGRSVRNFADDCVFDGNVLTSTSRNPRLFELAGKNCVIANNLMEALLNWWDYRSSCGVYAADENAKDNIISSNVVKNVCDCGIFAARGAAVVKDNVFATDGHAAGFVDVAGPENAALRSKLDEKYIISVTE